MPQSVNRAEEVLRGSAKSRRSSANTACQNRSSSRPTACDVILPHHIMLEVLSFHDVWAIIRARSISRSFASDAPGLVTELVFSSRHKFPRANQMHLFPSVTGIDLDGDKNLLQDAVVGLPWCTSLRRLRISCDIPQPTALSSATVASLCAIPVSELEIMRLQVEMPVGLAMPAWRTLQRLVLQNALIRDDSLANLVKSLPRGPLPLLALDLSRNPFGKTIEGMQSFASALATFPELRSLELTVDHIAADGAKLLLGALLDGACPKLGLLEMSLNFLDNGVIDFLAAGLARGSHGLRSLHRLGIGGRFSADESVTTFESLSRSLKVSGLPLLSYLHVQGDLGTHDVGPLLRVFQRGVCPHISVVKVERSTRFFPVEDANSIEDAVQSMLELVTCFSVCRLREVHVLGMNLVSG
ncbi:unnamed protein product, partial [Ascophyllum nodosum]